MPRTTWLPVFAGLLLAASVRADSPAPPSTYKEASANGKFVFVMIPNLSLEEELPRFNEEYQKKIKAIRQVYTKSGLYKNDGSKEPLWTVDWYAFGVIVGSDGVHLVRQGEWPFLSQRGENRKVTKDDLKQLAFSVYAKGKLVREYPIGEFVEDPKQLPMSVSHFSWSKKLKFDDANNHLEIVTHDRNRYLLDCVTSRILEKSKVIDKSKD